MHRRRQATEEELAQGEMEMQAAQNRLEEERLTSEELPLEDAPKEGFQRNKGTPSSAAKEALTQVPSASSSSRTSEASKDAKKTPEAKKEEGKTLRSTPRTARSQAGGTDGLGGVVEEVVISTPPKVRQPLFDEDQVQTLEEMHQKAPWLYSKFETPENSIQRPAFLDDEEGKTGEKDEERRLRRQQIALALEEKRRLEETERIAAEEERKFQKDQEERHQLARQIEMLVNENMSLRKDFEEMAKAKAPKSARPQDEDHKKDKQVRKLLEENLLLKSRLLRLEDSKPEEDAGAFATPNGSAEQDDPGPKASEERGEGRRFEESGRGKGKGSPEGQKPKDDQVPPQTLYVILKLMEGMQEIQKNLERRSCHFFKDTLA